VDVAKAVFEVAVSDRPGHVSRRERPTRGQFLAFMAQQPAATVVMEACGSAHHWGRKLQSLGHRVILLPPHHVRPYIRRNKTDRTDTKGILEASRNEEIRPVPVKTVAQQVLTSLHRLRSGWMLERTARLNALRGLLRELGVFIPVGAREVVPTVWGLIEDADSELPDALRAVFAEACREIREIEARVKQVERQLEAVAEQMPAVEHLRTIPGIGLLIATALVALIGDIRRFPSGRHLASYLGLTPREYSSGLKRKPGPHLQARGWLPAHSAHPRRALGAGPRAPATAGPPQGVGEQPREDPRPQQGRGGRRQQAHPDRVGGVVSRAALRLHSQGCLKSHPSPRNCLTQRA
jgi:transposase